MTSRTRAARKRGFTLIELLVAIGAMGIVLFYTLGTFTANRNAYVVIDQVSEAHQNLLAIASLMERDIRNAGYMVPSGAASCGQDNTNAADILFVSDADAILPADGLPSNQAGDDLSVNVSGLPTKDAGSIWSNPTTFTTNDIVLDGTATYPTTPAADFRPGGGVIFFNPSNPGRGVGCGIVAPLPGGTTSLAFSAVNGPDNNTAITGWTAVPAHVYRLNGDALERDGVVLARHVEDLQFAWFYDDDDDGQVDPGEYVGAAGTTYSPNAIPGTSQGLTGDPGTLREIRLNIVVRTSDNDPKEINAGAGQATENQTAAPGPDGRRRRVYTSTIRLRNLVP